MTALDAGTAAAVPLDDHQLAASLAETAGDLLLRVQGSGLVAGKALGATGDATSHQFLVGALAFARPDDRILSEEGSKDDSRHDPRVWIVDPVDGTREFSEGRDDWAVHVALVERHNVIAAAVAMPGLGVTFSTSQPAVLGPIGGPLTILVSRSRPPTVAVAVADALGGTLVGMGSAGAKAMAVVRGEAHAYLHAGGQYEWDSAAPVGVALAAGLHATRLDGSPLVYDQSDPLLPDVLICRREVAEQLLAAIAALAAHS